MNMWTCCGSQVCSSVGACYWLKNVSAERERESLSCLIYGGQQRGHGTSVNQPDWSDHSHSFVLSAEIQQEKLLGYLIV
jgi:hypothetical protein